MSSILKTPNPKGGGGSGQSGTGTTDPSNTDPTSNDPHMPQATDTASLAKSRVFLSAVLRYEGHQFDDYFSINWADDLNISEPTTQEEIDAYAMERASFNVLCHVTNNILRVGPFPASDTSNSSEFVVVLMQHGIDSIHDFLSLTMESYLLFNGFVIDPLLYMRIKSFQKWYLHHIGTADWREQFYRITRLDCPTFTTWVSTHRLLAEMRLPIRDASAKDTPIHDTHLDTGLGWVTMSHSRLPSPQFLRNPDMR